MLSTLDLMIIKEYAKGEDIIYLNIAEREFVFRTIGVGEYLNVRKCVDNEKDLEDGVCQTTLLYPDKNDIVFGTYPLAGVSAIAYKEIINNSGLNGMSEIRERILIKKDEMNIFHNQCVNLVKAAFNELTIEEIEQYSWCKLVDLAVRAEAIMAIRGSDFRLIDTNNLDDDSEIDFIEEEIVETVEEKTTREYLEEGIEPMLYHADEILSNNGKELLDSPFIGGLRWNEEDVIDAISEQF